MAVHRVDPAVCRALPAQPGGAPGRAAGEGATVVFMAGRDEQVSLRSETCMRGNPAIMMKRMPQSTHHLFTPEDKAAVKAALLNMCIKEKV